MVDLQEAGCELTVFLADWHAWINDKLDGSLDRIAAAGQDMRSAFQALGVSEDATRWRWAHELTGSSEDRSRVVRVAKTTSLARTKRAMTILGRTEEEEGLDTAKLFYPSMQAADIFELPVDLAYAGLDQRRAHVLAREVAHHYHWPVPVAVHTPLVSSLKGGGRMDAANAPERKMSKSDPTEAIIAAVDPRGGRGPVEGRVLPGEGGRGESGRRACAPRRVPVAGTAHRTPRPPARGGPDVRGPVPVPRRLDGGRDPPRRPQGGGRRRPRRDPGPVGVHFAHHPTEAPAAF